MRRVILPILSMLFLLVGAPSFAAEGEPAPVEGAVPPRPEGDPAAVPPAAPPRDDYRIGPEDALRISVWDNRELTQDVVVRPDGKISLPLLQDVEAEGRTAPDLAMEITRRLTAFIKEPQVSVILLQVNAPKVYVLGNVVRPGTYPLRGSLTVLQALSLAGGMTPFADTGSIRIVRTTEDGSQKVREVNFKRLIESNGKSNHPLKPGDTIVVP